MRIHVIVPAFNCYNALVRCLGSLYAQVYDDMNVVVIDDASPDPLMQEAITDMCKFAGWTPVLNSENLQCPQNICRGIAIADPGPHDVIFILDGDDFLPHANVMSRIAQVYKENPETWLTYGSYETFPYEDKAPVTGWYPPEVVENRSYRTHSFTLFNHPITFKHFLWAALDEDVDFKFPDGEWVAGVYDEAIMYPMLEMATNHYQHLDHVLYVYNSINPLSVQLSMPDRIRKAGEYLRSLPILPLMRLEGDGLVEEGMQ